jgi:hypothetical protein
MTSDINDKSIDVFCKLLMDGIQVNPEARPVVMSLIDTLMDNNVRQEHWGMILFRVWQELHEEPSSGAHHDGNGR